MKTDEYVDYLVKLLFNEIEETKNIGSSCVCGCEPDFKSCKDCPIILSDGFDKIVQKINYKK